MFLYLMFTKAPVETVIFWNIIAILNNYFLFLYILTLLQFSVSHDLSEIILICWFAAQDTFLNINNVENNYKLLQHIEINSALSIRSIFY